jgi:8-oxo-dGTP diphosphatase
VREQCERCGAVAWRNPVPVGMALIEHEGRLVLIRRLAEPLAGYWAPPAGYVESGESVPEAVLREARKRPAWRSRSTACRRVLARRRECADRRLPRPRHRRRAPGRRRRHRGRPLRAGRIAAGTAAESGVAIDEWFYGVIRDATARWRPQTQGDD